MTGYLQRRSFSDYSSPNQEALLQLLVCIMARQEERLCSMKSLTVIGFWMSLGFQMSAGSVTGASSSSSYFVFQHSEYPRDCNEALITCPSTHNTSGVYLIKPDGYPEPFEVYCDNDLHVGGWTVFERRSTGSINFNRTWEEFRNGFGFLGSEFWLGNDKIAYLTNQKKYQLRIDFQNSEGQSYSVTHGNFKISDEYGEYSLSSLGSYSGTAESYIVRCPTNEVFSSNPCERTCDEPEECISGTSEEKCACIGNYKIHQGNCIADNQCGCFLPVNRKVLPNGESYVNSDCTSRSNCTNNSLDVEDDYSCSDDATCKVIDGVHGCYCNESFEGDGVTCTRDILPKDCQELYDDGRSDGVYTIYPDGYPEGVQVRCDMEANVGGWTIFQRRLRAFDFDRDWLAYENGFGSPRQDHWLGNRYIHAMTHQKTYKLRIDMTDSRSSSYHAIYSTFSISDGSDKYRLSLGSYTGNAGYNDFFNHNNGQFSTRDQDNDGCSRYHCAQKHTGGWWSHYCYSCYSSFCTSSEHYCEAFQHGSCCAFCYDVNLNGDYNGAARGTSIFWDYLRGYDCGIQYTEMKILPV